MALKIERQERDNRMLRRDSRGTSEWEVKKKERVSITLHPLWIIAHIPLLHNNIDKHQPNKHSNQFLHLHHRHLFVVVERKLVVVVVVRNILVDLRMLVVAVEEGNNLLVVGNRHLVVDIRLVVVGNLHILLVVGIHDHLEEEHQLEHRRSTECRKGTR